MDCGYAEHSFKCGFTSRGNTSITALHWASRGSIPGSSADVGIFKLARLKWWSLVKWCSSVSQRFSFLLRILSFWQAKRFPLIGAILSCPILCYPIPSYPTLSYTFPSNPILQQMFFKVCWIHLILIHFSDQSASQGKKHKIWNI